MAQVTVEDSFTFVGGLNVEGGYFTTPKNSWIEGYNIVPKKDGSVERRPSFVYEDNYNTITTFSTIEDKAFTVETWDNVGGQRDTSWFVVQVGNIVYFYESFTGTVSGRAVYGTINNIASYPASIALEDYRCEHNTNDVAKSVISVTSVYGNLLITHQDCEPILVTWSEGNALSVNPVKLKIRDFKGIKTTVDDSLEKTESEWDALGFWPHALYNLFNQGWTDEKLAAYLSYSGGRYPANTKQWIHGKDTNDDFSTEVLSKVDFGSTPAPKGRFILEAFNEDRATALEQMPDINEGLITSTVTPTTGRDNLFDFEYWQKYGNP